MTQTLTSAFLASLIAPAVLDTVEVQAALAAEMQREKEAVEQAMAAVVADGRRRTFYLSCAIYEPVAVLEERLFDSESRLSTISPRSRPYLEGAIQQGTVELQVARRLRRLRAPVSHMDPPNYWEKLRQREATKPIQCNHSWRDAA